MTLQRVALIVALLFAVGPVQAAEDGVGPSPEGDGGGVSVAPEAEVPALAVWLGSSAADQAEVGAALAEFDPAVMVDELVPLGALLGGGTQGLPLVAAGVEAREGCAGTPFAADDYRAGIGEADRALLEMEDPRPLTSSLLASWPCLDSVLPPEELVFPAFFAGSYQVVAPNEEVGETFDQIFAVTSTFPWDPSLPPTIQAAYQDARERVWQLGRGKMKVVVPDGWSVWVDGTLLESPADGFDVPPGRHLVQASADEAPVVGLVVTTRADTEALVVASGLLDGLEPTTGGASGLLSDLLVGLQAEGRRVDYVVALGDPTTVFRWDGETGATSQVISSAGLHRSGAAGAPGGRRTAGTVMIGVGAATLVAGAVIAGVTFGKGQPYSEMIGADAGYDDLYRGVAEDYQTGNQVGWGVAVAGGAILAAGIPLAAIAPRKFQDESATSDTTLSIQVSPAGARFGLSGRF
jgi:hypothetical protein